MRHRVEGVRAGVWVAIEVYIGYGCGVKVCTMVGMSYRVESVCSEIWIGVEPPSSNGGGAGIGVVSHRDQGENVRGGGRAVVDVGRVVSSR